MSKKIRYILCVTLACALGLTVFSGCGKPSQDQSGLTIEDILFWEIPGINDDEISAIRNLQGKNSSFVYGMSLSSDAFTGRDGEIQGYAALICDRLTKIFGIPFRIEFFEWDDLLKGLESGAVDFTSELIDTSENRETYFMTSPITQRPIKYYRINGGVPLEEIIRFRRPYYAFLRGSVTSADIAANADYDFETIIVNSHAAAYRMLESGEVDAFVGSDTAEAAFDIYGNVVSKDFLPMIFRSSCLSTRKAELQPIINVVEKTLNERTLGYLAELYKTGYQQYLENKLYNLLTEEEKAYIQNNPVIPVTAEFNNYPVCFFDTNTNQWNGIYFDALNEIARLTGLTFMRVNDQNATFQDLIAMLESGKALMVPELFRIQEYQGRFLWSEVPVIEDNFAFLSKSDYRNIEISQIPYLKVGVRRDSIYSEVFKKIFPNHRHLVEYDTQEEVWNSLKQDEVEVIFACNRRLLIYTNYYEEAVYKLNLILNHSFDSSFGYNKDAVILKSIVDKTLSIINTNNIANQWMHKTYDYRYKLAEAQRPWLIGALILFFLVLVLVLILLIRSRSTGRRLETLVGQRTGELAFKTSQLQMMIDSIPDLMFCKDINLRYTQCNKHFEDFIGVRETDINGKADADGAWLSPDSVKNIINIEQSVLNENRIIKLEEYISAPLTGKGRFFETVKAPLIQNGVVVGMMGIARDITGRKAMEKEIAYQTSLLKNIIDSLPDAVFCKDGDFKYTLCNKYMADLFNKKLEDILKNDDETALGMSAEAAEIANDYDRKVINELQRVAFEEWLPCADGVTRLFETVKVPLLMDGGVTGILGIGRDITQRKAMEEEIQTASQAKSAFLANMSHEIRSPLNVIIGLTDLILEDERLERQVAENLVKISNAGTTLLSIVNDILDFSKIESGKLELTPVEYYTSSLLNDIITLVITRLGEKPIIFRLNIDDDLPVKLYGDDLRVKQIFTNLLSNAVKYTHQGSIELSVHCTREDDTMWLDVTISDTGIGIREEDIKKLFSDYNQVDVKANRNIEGTGLGLAITKRLADMMDGEISAESEYGKGTTFRLRIRQGFVSDTPIGTDIANKLRSFCYAEDKRIVTKKLVRLNLSYARVLVVDDMQTNLDVAAGLLRKYKMQVDCLISGKEAVERIRGGTPVYNAIFMDHMMPGMDGIEAAEAIRALGTEYAQKIPIIALTANAIHGTDQMFYEHGFQAFISKPIDIIEMDSIIRKWVRSASQENTLVTNDAETDTSDENLVIDIPGVNTEKGLSLYGGDTNIYLSVLRSFTINTPGVLNGLRVISRETLSDYVISVHGLKGACAGIGAETIREAALNLETMSRAGDLDGVLAQNDQLIKDAETVLADVKVWIDNYDACHEKPLLKVPDREVLAQLRHSCENYDMSGIDTAMSKLESAAYEEGADLVAWLKEKIGVSEIAEAAARLAQYEEELGK
ncbi:MAG: PAS domain-containing protein [Treponema sp.]|jgi:PAS domain S-box-containing protein|nr:PAS domain-containing protein [Treponema sp.]